MPFNHAWDKGFSVLKGFYLLQYSVRSSNTIRLCETDTEMLNSNFVEVAKQTLIKSTTPKDLNQCNK